jgi:hypothetical protein
MPKTSDDMHVANIPDPSIPRIYSILSDTGCVKILDMIFERRQPKVKDLGTRKRYYEKIARLTKAHLITENKIGGKQQQQEQQTKANEDGYELTDWGLSVYGILLLLRRAHDLRIKLEAIDTLDESMPPEALNNLIEELIPDESIRKILLKDRRRLIMKLNSIYSR